MYSSKRYGEEALTKCMQLPRERRQNESWPVSAMDAGMASLNIEESQRALGLFAFYRT